MAEIIQNKDLEDNKKEAPQAPGTQVAPSAGPSPSSTQPQVGGAAAPKTTAQAPAGAGPRQGSGFTNLQRILQAQSGAGQRLGQQIAGGLGQQVQQAQQGLQTSQQQFQQQAGQAAVKLNPQDQSRLQAILANPAQASQEDMAFVQQMRDAQYAGPQNLQNAQAIQQQAAQVAALGQADRASLLQRFAASPGTVYRPGQQRLDALLLGSAPMQQIQAQTRAAQALGRDISQATTGAEAQASKLLGEAQQARETTRGALGQAISQFGTEAQQAQQQAQTSAQQQYQQALARAQQGQVSAADLERYGLFSGMDTYGVNLADYLSGPGTATEISALTPEKAAQIQALSQLSGQSGVGSDILQRFGDISQAGTFAQQDPYSVDAQRYKQAIEQQRGAYEQRLAPVQQALNESLGGAVEASQMYGSKIATALDKAGLNRGTRGAEDMVLNAYNAWKRDPKGFQEGIIGDQQGVGGAERDRLIFEFNKRLAAEQTGQQLGQQYGIGQRLGVV